MSNTLAPVFEEQKQEYEQVDDQPDGPHFQIITSSIFGDDYKTIFSLF